MFDPDFESGKKGGLFPPNGDWTKFREGRLANDATVSVGNKFSVVVVAIAACALLIWVLPIPIAALVASLTALLGNRDLPRSRTWLPMAIWFTACGFAGLCVYMTIFLVLPSAPEEITTALFSERMEVDGYITIVPNWLYWACHVVPSLTIFFALMWACRPLHQPQSTSLQVTYWMISCLVMLLTSTAVAVSSLLVLRAADVISADDAAALSGGVLTFPPTVVESEQPRARNF
ncbi:hypothetical protein [Brevundimonas aveniformis]|uniref:hypothetical protein n=1 Tax=Brevundimonas aveniformis TaxID=370977 RepID=UPI00048CD7EA|nr:hypothetical protein [Brevundimonas aveniformis]